MNIGAYRIHFDALLARLLFRWRVQTIVIFVIFTACIGFSSGIVPPFWKHQAHLTLYADSQATITVNGKPWPYDIYEGSYRVLAAQPDGRASWADISLHATPPLTLTLPVGLPEPRERSLPAAAPDWHVSHVYRADNAWRVVSEPNSFPKETQDDAVSSATTQATQTIAIGTEHVERLATLDAYAGVADQLHVQSQLFEAVYKPNTNQGYNDNFGQLEIRGWTPIAVTVPVSTPVTLLRFSSTGEGLLSAETLPSGGEQIYFMPRQGTRTPVVAVPGHITRLTWRTDGTAVVIHSVQNERLTLTLVRIVPSIIAAAIADLPAVDYAGSIVPLDWDDTGLLWVAPDSDGTETLWHVPITSLMPERRGSLAARALTYLNDGTVRVVQTSGNVVSVGRYQDGLVIGETVIPRIAASNDLRGMWQGDELLLQSGERVWLLTMETQQGKGN